MLLPPPYVETNKEYLRMLSTDLNIKLEEIIEQMTKFDTVSKLANIYCLLNFMVYKDSGIPLSTYITKDLADFLSSKEFGKLAGNYTKQLNLLNGNMLHYKIYNNIYKNYL